MTHAGSGRVQGFPSPGPQKAPLPPAGVRADGCSGGPELGEMGKEGPGQGPEDRV